jgi:glycerophosphoryl diester phosphodiesterase
VNHFVTTVLSNLAKGEMTLDTPKNSPMVRLKIRRWLHWLGTGLFILFLPLVLSYSLYLTLRQPPPPNPQLIAHRGAHKGKSTPLPENTLAAFQQALDIGVDWLELDVHMTQDGVLVVIHDETVDRTTDGTGWVKDMTLEQLRVLDAGSGERIPTFEEVLDLAKEARVGLLPEIKSAQLYPGIEAKLVQQIVEADYVENTAIQSFTPEVLDTVHTLNSNLRVCPLYGLGHLTLSGPQPGEANTVCPMAEMVFLNPWMLHQAHTRNRQVFVWFGLIEHPLTMRLLLALGADGLMVDDPRTLAGILQR